MIHVVKTALKHSHLLADDAEDSSEVWSDIVESTAHTMFEFHCVQLLRSYT